MMAKLEDAIHFGVVGVLLSAAAFGLLFAMTELIPEPDVTQSCTCAGKSDCYTQVFQVDDEHRAFCAFYSDKEECCIVVSR